MGATGPLLTEAGNSERFAARVFGRYVFVHGWDCWRVWDGRRLAADGTRQVVAEAILTVRAMHAEAATVEDDGARKALVRHALASESSRGLEAMLRLASAHPDLAVKAEDLDANPWLLNVENGTLDLRAASLHPASAQNLITRLAPVTFDPAALCPLWDAFLRRITGGNERLRGFLQRAAGYSLTGDVTEHALFIPYGSGANGKSTFLEVLLGILGDYAKPAAPGLLMRSRENRNEEATAELHGIRLATGQETGVDQALDEPRLKLLTGGDTVSARRLYSARFEFRPTHKLWLATNHRPRVRGGDDGVWRRLKLIPFDQVIAEHERDPRLKEKLLGEASGILAWAVKGCLAWQRDGLGVPEEVREATASYRAAEDTVGPFLQERCLGAQGLSVSGSSLFDSYRRWAEDAGGKAMSVQALAEALEARGFEKKRTNRGALWVGLGLKVGPSDGGDGGGSFSDNSPHARAEGRLS